MFELDLSNEKPLYSHVVSIPRFALMQNQSQLSTSSTETTDSDNDHSNNDPESPSHSHLGKETFQIDRRKLERMIQASSSIEEGLNAAEHFFNNIMKTTDTLITWPKNLRIGARTRKDPFVNIIGRPNDITWAKGLILASLGTRGPLLKLKMFIAENDHPHVIGRSGSNVKSIMEQTDTHIHFPDSNRRTLTEKNNQVLIYGTVESLERARASLRSSTPLVMSFELPFGIPLPRHDVPDVNQLETDFGVNVIFMATPNRSSYFVVVKGTQEIANKLKVAVKILVRATCGTGAPYTLSNIKLEIPKQIFDLANMENRINLLDLQEKTQTTISVPESSESGQNISVIGSVDMIYEVQKEIMSHLPVELTFDIPENPYHTSDIMSLGLKYGISLSMRHKEKSNSIVVTMGAAEGIISHIYEAHQEVAGMQNTSRDETEFPKAYFLVEPAYRRALENNNMNNGSHYEEITRKIWAPKEPNTESNFLYVEPSGGDHEGQALFCNFEESAEEPSQHEAQPLALLSPGTTCSNDDCSQGRRSSGDWSVMRPIVHNDNQHFECDFDSEDMEVAFIFMSSTKNLNPVFPNAPGAERL
ncbi:protein bicaudal C-like [Eupeodes corollae]|uniref:protein bicaudal C-like n=1 Tax=Eupeodes corollae TaxID=290404 RepID=UPI002492F74A|nr:protein bicaudal C-like [Eupeodes corollae]